MWHESMPQGPQVEKHSPNVEKSNQSGQVKLKIPFFLSLHITFLNLNPGVLITLSFGWSEGPLVFPMKKKNFSKNLSLYG